MKRCLLTHGRPDKMPKLCFPVLHKQEGKCRIPQRLTWSEETVNHKQFFLQWVHVGSQQQAGVSTCKNLHTIILGVCRHQLHHQSNPKDLEKSVQTLQGAGLCFKIDFSYRSSGFSSGAAWVEYNSVLEPMAHSNCISLIPLPLFQRLTLTHKSDDTQIRD